MAEPAVAPSQAPEAGVGASPLVRKESSAPDALQDNAGEAHSGEFSPRVRSPKKFRHSEGPDLVVLEGGRQRSPKRFRDSPTSEVSIADEGPQPENRHHPTTRKPKQFRPRHLQVVKPDAEPTEAVTTWTRRVRNPKRFAPRPLADSTTAPEAEIFDRDSDEPGVGTDASTGTVETSPTHTREGRVGPRRTARKAAPRLRAPKKLQPRQSIGEATDLPVYEDSVTKATPVIGDHKLTQTLPVVPELPSTEEVSLIRPEPPVTEVVSNISVEQAQKVEERAPAASYDLVHPSPEGQHPYNVLRNGWLRATALDAARKVGAGAHKVFEGAVGAIGLAKVIDNVENTLPGGYPETQEISAVGDEGESTAEMNSLHEDTEGLPTEESELAKPTSELELSQTMSENEGEMTEDLSLPNTAEQAVAGAGAPATITDSGEVGVNHERVREAWREFEALLDSSEATPEDIVNSARHIAEVSDYRANTARKLAQDVMYYAKGPEAKEFVEELARGRIESGSENADDIRHELLHIAELNPPLPRLTANVPILKREIRVAEDGSIIFPKTFPQVRDEENKVTQPSEAGRQMHALKALEKGDFSGYQFLPEQVRAELEEHQLRPGQANAADKAAIAQISLRGARFVKPPGSGQVPESPQTRPLEAIAP